MEKEETKLRMTDAVCNFEFEELSSEFAECGLV